MKKGDLIITINGVNFYYLCKDKVFTYDNRPCHFLTTDLKNKNASFRVSENPENWPEVCEGIYSKIYA